MGRLPERISAPNRGHCEHRQAAMGRRPEHISALFKGGGPLRLRNGGGLAALAAFPFKGGRQPGLLLHKGFCPPCLYPPFARAGGSMRSMGGGLAAPGCVSLQSQRSWHPTAADKKEGPSPLFFHSLFFFNIPSSRAPTAVPTAKEARYMGQLWTTPNTKMPP